MQGRFGRLAKPMLNIVVLLLAMVGLAHVLDYASGDGSLPRFRSLRDSASHLQGRLYRNRSLKLARQEVSISTADGWQAMQPAFFLVRAIAPEIADWLNRMHTRNRIVYRLLPLQRHFFSRQIYLSSNVNWGVLNVGPAFWNLRDGDKAAFLIHEYRHFRQNRPKVIASLTAEVLSGTLPEYGSVLEDEAFLYQNEAYRALGMPNGLIRPYLRRRNLLHFDKINTCQPSP